MPVNAGKQLKRNHLKNISFYILMFIKESKLHALKPKFRLLADDWALDNECRSTAAYQLSDKNYKC